MVSVVQLVERQIVVLVVVGSSPPFTLRKESVFGLTLFLYMHRKNS